MNEHDTFATVMKRPPGTLYHCGYTAPGAEAEIEQFMRDPHTLLLDIRLRPLSRWRPMWNKKQLQARWGKRYLHCRDLGNVNYNDRSLPIVLCNPGPPLTLAAWCLGRGYSLVLLCACKEYVTCHRKVVVELLEQRLAVRA